jgi:hypothetical protein
MKLKTRIKAGVCPRTGCDPGSLNHNQTLARAGKALGAR